MMLSAELMRDRITSLESARVNSVRKSVYRSVGSLQRELERIYSLNVRLTSRLLVRSGVEESDQA
jgi:hypothetical protein